MDKADAEQIANQLLNFYGLPEDERISVITGVLHVYGKPVGGQIMTRQAAEGIVKQINDRPERYPLTYNKMPFVAKRAWLEGDEEAGKVMVEYGRKEE